MPRSIKKTVKEAQFNIDATKMVGNQPQTITHAVSAGNDADALRQMQQNTADIDDYTQMIVTRMDGPNAANAKKINIARKKQAAAPSPSGPGMPNAPTPLTPGKSRIQPGAGGLPESFDASRFRYPYTVMLPASFEDAVSKAICEGVERVRSHTVLLRITNEAAMTNFVKTLAKSRRDANAKTVLEGILRSTR